MIVSSKILILGCGCRKHFLIPSIQSKFTAVATLLYGKEHIQIISNHGIIKSEKSKQNKNTELNIL